MPSQKDPSRSHSHLPHIHSSRSPRPKSRNANEPLNLSQQNVTYLAVAVLGGALLIAKPALLIFVLALMGYGRYYHVETHERRRGLWGERETERSLHFGPDPSGGKVGVIGVGEVVGGLGLGGKG
jgi:hypothetical protein